MADARVLGPMIRVAEPCDAYFGNVCGGFGAACVCLGCGWDRVDHPSEFTAFKDLFANGAVAVLPEIHWRAR